MGGEGLGWGVDHQDRFSAGINCQMEDDYLLLLTPAKNLTLSIKGMSPQICTYLSSTSRGVLLGLGKHENQIALAELTVRCSKECLCRPHKLRKVPQQDMFLINIKQVL